MSISHYVIWSGVSQTVLGVYSYSEMHHLISNGGCSEGYAYSINYGKFYEIMPVNSLSNSPSYLLEEGQILIREIDGPATQIVVPQQMKNILKTFSLLTGK